MEQEPRVIQKLDRSQITIGARNAEAAGTFNSYGGAVKKLCAYTKIMIKYDLAFKFKGDRNYVQGPDIINAVINVLSVNYKASEVKNFKYVAHKMLHTNGVLTIGENPVDDAYSLISFIYEGRILFASVQPALTDIEDSVQYDESFVKENSSINGNEISIKYENIDCSFSELIVSLNKYFLQQTVSKSGKWIITKLEYFDLGFFPGKGMIVALCLEKIYIIN